MLALCDASAEQFRAETRLKKEGADHGGEYFSPEMRTFYSKYRKTRTYELALESCPDVRYYDDKKKGK
jgi:hypothetical protein